jgi:hypothetical protein
MTSSVTVSNCHRSYADRKAQWDKIRHCLEGEDCVKDQGTGYLPQPEAMTTQRFVTYKQRASFYAVAERTLRGLSGMVFRHMPILKVPAKMEPMRDNVTIDGQSTSVLSQEIMDEVLTIGLYGILVDFPMNAPSNALPHFVTYKAESITDIKQENRNGKYVPVQIILKENRDGIQEEGYLELRLNSDNVYETVRHAPVSAPDAKTSFAPQAPKIPLVNGKPLNYIPFVFFTPYSLKPEYAKPPFLDICNVNLAHYRNNADYEYALYLTAQPTPWIASGMISETDRPQTIGSGSMWFLPENAKVGMLEFTGAGLNAQRTAMQDKEGWMAVLGARMINDVAKKQETSQTARLRGRAETSLVTSAVNMVEAGLNKAFKIAAEWTGSTTEDMPIQLNKDFVEVRMDPSELTALVRTWQVGAISKETLHHNLQRGELVPPDVTVEDEQDKIDDEGLEIILEEGSSPEEGVTPEMSENTKAPEDLKE